jgi:hypothetical protein
MSSPNGRASQRSFLAVFFIFLKVQILFRIIMPAIIINNTASDVTNTKIYSTLRTT